MSRLSFRGVPATLLCVSVAACGDSCRDKPYVPYSIDDASSPHAPSATVDGGSVAPPLVDAGPSAVAPGSTRWELDGASVSSPAGSAFSAGIAVVVDGAVEGIGVVRASGDGRRASIVRVSRGVLTVIAEHVHTLADASCSPTDRVSSAGEGAAFIELSAACAGHESATTVTRYVGLVRRGAIVWNAKLVDPAYAPRIKLDAESVDVDGDGKLDLRLRFALEAVRSPKGEIAAGVHAALVFVDRPSGLSLDTSEPEASLSAIAKRAASLATKKGEKLAAIATARQARALHLALCGEGGAPRLTGLPGRDHLSCGDSAALEAATLAEARAHFEDRAPAAAISTLAGSVPGARRDEAGRKRIWQDLSKLEVILGGVKESSIAPELGPSPSPGLGALAFGEGGLFVRSAGAVFRIDDGGTPTKTDEPAWPRTFESPSKKERFVDVFADCEAFGAFVNFAPLADGEVRDVAVTLVPPPDRGCKAGRAPALAAFSIAWDDGGLVFASQGRLVRVKADKAEVLSAIPKLVSAPRGSAASPAGTRWVIPTARGLFVGGGEKGTLLVARELEPYDDLRDCTVNDDASRVACAKKDRVLVGRR